MAEQLISTAVHHTLPESYVRAEPERPRLDEVVPDADIPVVDLTNPDRAAVVAEIGTACRIHRFFQVLNHGLPVEAMQAAMAVAHEFFRLSPDEKSELFSDDPVKKMRLSTSFNVRKETVHNWRDYLRLLEQLVPEWPASPPFRGVMSTYFKDVRELYAAIWKKPQTNEPMIHRTDQLQIIKNEDIKQFEKLGFGASGTVYRAKWKGTDVAVKRFWTFFPSSEEEQEFSREVDMLSKLRHPNVVAFYGIVKDGPGDTQLATLTEFMVNGSLGDVLRSKDKGLDLRKRLIIATDAAIGMEYLHSKNIVHFDLKSYNLLVDLRDRSRPICKVCDFGLSKIRTDTLVSGGMRGTPRWMAPEQFDRAIKKVSEKVDVFSFGIVLWELLTGEIPYASMDYNAIAGGVVNNTLRPPLPANCGPEWRMLMEQCWSPDPAARPAFTEIVARLQSMLAAAE